MSPSRLAVPRAAVPFTAVILFAAVLPSTAFPGSTPAATAPGATAADDPSGAGIGSLYAQSPDGWRRLPALGIEVDLAIAGPLVGGTLRQSFRNDGPDVVNAIYVFPLPESAAVDSMEVRIGDRTIRSAVRERREAQARFEAAKSGGQKAALVEQSSRRGLFRTSVANINPGEMVAVDLHLHAEAEWRGDGFRFAFPLTWTPRYDLGATAPAALGTESGHTGGAAAAFTAGASPGAPRVRVRAVIDAGLPPGAVRSPSHPLRVQRTPDGPAPSRATAETAGDVPADRDLILEWSVAGDATRGAVFAEEREDGLYALAMLVPPAAGAAVDDGLATRTLFLVDVSGSMEGPSIDQARGALLAALARLRPTDSFDVASFSNETTFYRDDFLPATPTAVAQAASWVGGLRAGGGTEMLAALDRSIAAINAGAPPRARRIVLVTDGAVDAPDEAFRALAARLDGARLHVLGIGPAPNRPLMRSVARLGHGLSEFIADRSDVGARMEQFLARIERPVLGDLRLSYDGAPPIDPTPETLPDLYAGEPLFVSMRLGPGHPGTTVRLDGWSAAGPVALTLPVSPDAPRGAGVAARWARGRILGLLDRRGPGGDDAAIRSAVLDLGLRFSLVTPYTSLVAVEEAPTAQGASHDAPVPAVLPAGSAIGEGMLPQTGTLEPLLLRAGLFLMLLGAALFGLARLVPAPRPRT